MLGINNIARICAIILINLPPNVNARTITVTLTVADNDIILEFLKIAILLHYLRKFTKKITIFTSFKEIQDNNITLGKYKKKI